MKLEHSSHSAAVARATSYFSSNAAYSDRTGGIGLYHFLEDLLKDFDEKKQMLAEKLKEVSKKLFTVDNMLLSYIADENGFAYLDEAMKQFTDTLPKGSGVIIHLRLSGKTATRDLRHLPRSTMWQDAETSVKLAMHIPGH